MPDTNSTRPADMNINQPLADRPLTIGGKVPKVICSLKRAGVCIYSGDGMFLSHAGEWYEPDILDPGSYWPTSQAAEAFIDQNADKPAVETELNESAEKHRASYLTVSQAYNLNIACRPLALFGYGTFHVGSSLDKPDFHDVDLRCIMPDEEYDRLLVLFTYEGILFLNTAISDWVASRSGLPIDFQFQRATQANETFKGRRNGVGH